MTDLEFLACRELYGSDWAAEYEAQERRQWQAEAYAEFQRENGLEPDCDDEDY